MIALTVFLGSGNLWHLALTGDGGAIWRWLVTGAFLMSASGTHIWEVQHQSHQQTGQQQSRLRTVLT